MERPGLRRHQPFDVARRQLGPGEQGAELAGIGALGPSAAGQGDQESEGDPLRAIEVAYPSRRRDLTRPRNGHVSVVPVLARVTELNADAVDARCLIPVASSRETTGNPPSVLSAVVPAPRGERADSGDAQPRGHGGQTSAGHRSRGRQKADRHAVSIAGARPRRIRRMP